MAATEIRPTPRLVVPLVSASAVFCLLVALAILFLFEPGRYTFYPRCLFHEVTGLLCPGCGSLRAVHQLLHGNVIAALHLNALLVLAIPAGVWLLLRQVTWNRRNQTQLVVLKPVWLWTVLIIGILFGVLRNLSFAQSLWLAP